MCLAACSHSLALCRGLLADLMETVSGQLFCLVLQFCRCLRVSGMSPTRQRTIFEALIKTKLSTLPFQAVFYLFGNSLFSLSFHTLPLSLAFLHLSYFILLCTFLVISAFLLLATCHSSHLFPYLLLFSLFLPFFPLCHSLSISACWSSHCFGCS